MARDLRPTTFVRSLSFSVCSVVLSFFSFAIAAAPAAAKSLHVVATVGDLGAIAREVLGGGEVTVLARPTQDPHFVDAKPNLILDLNRADALLAMGLDYEIGWLPVLVRGARNAAIQLGGPGYVDASTMIAPLEVPSGRVDRSMGDIHPGGNPHFTLDPRNGVRIARGLAERFGRLDPAGQQGYVNNAEAFARRLEARIADWQRLMAPHQGAGVVTYHKSFVYFTSWLGLQEVDELEPKPGIPPNPPHIAEVVARMRARKVNAILQERWYPSSTASVVAQQTGAKLVLIAGMTPIGGSYIDHIDEVVRAVAEGLS
jgi:zinc/manganese transport system substrate-binding protein